MKILAVCNTRDSLLELSGSLSETSLASAQINGILVHELAVNPVTECRHDVIFMELDDSLASIPACYKALCASQAGSDTVFLSSSDRFLKEAFSLHACGYLVRPWLPADIEREIGNLHSHARPRELVLNTPDGTVRIPYEDILYIDKMERAAVCHTSGGDAIVTRKLRESFSSAFSMLLEAPDFTLSGRTLIVNMKEIEAFSSDKYICLTGGRQVYPPVRDYYRLKQSWERLFDSP